MQSPHFLNLLVALSACFFTGEFVQKPAAPTWNGTQSQVNGYYYYTASFSSNASFSSFATIRSVWLVLGSQTVSMNIGNSKNITGALFYSLSSNLNTTLSVGSVNQGDIVYIIVEYSYGLQGAIANISSWNTTFNFFSLFYRKPDNVV